RYPSNNVSVAPSDSVSTLNVLMHGLRRMGLTGTAYARAQCTTIRLKWLKIGARVRISVRKVWLSFSESYAHAGSFAQILANLQKHPPWLAPG
ncbi:MAG: transposase, partial [Rhodospirillaceae bacterium]|nr:transposase [Rhodospirillaceae bacterium]